MLSADTLRQKYLDFFQSKGHAIIPSASLLPENDPTTLFTGSGMQPMLPYLLGQPHPLGPRLANSQKCFRSSDIADVGDNRHTTFFEMLGNWSLGDYFKEEQIAWIFTFVVHELGMDPNRLFVTVFRGNPRFSLKKDETSIRIWKQMFAGVGIQALDVDSPEKLGMQGGHIFSYDERKNWWSRAGIADNMPVGEPGGPDTEMFWDFGVEHRLHEASMYKEQPCHVNCDCGRFMEIGNSVFMEYMKSSSEVLPLKQKNVDFGGGLERLLAAKQDNPDMFRIDLFAKALRTLEMMSNKQYGTENKETRAFRVILDHLRAATFLLSDGITPSNKDQGYFVRRLLRRAIRFSHSISIQDIFCGKVAASYISAYEKSYPQLVAKQDTILEAMEEEEKKFRKTLHDGLKIFERIAKGKNAASTLSGEETFNLYQTYGFPFELTEELAAERNIAVDTVGFQKELVSHQEKSRLGAEQKFSGGLADHSEKCVQYHTATHLLQQALRRVLGEHVLQRGSNITNERLRFDFSHQRKMTKEEIAAVEKLVNEQIEAALPVEWKILPIEEAEKLGAIGLFEEKYGDNVKVYKIGDFSLEFCGGPHVENTSNLVGRFKILKEEACSAGVRRIKAVLQ